MKDRTTAFTWTAVPGATGYVLEIGRTTTASDFAVITLEGAITTHRATDMPVGISFARVRAKNASATSAAGSELRFIVPDLRDVIEALFFGTGPNRYTTPNGFSETPRGNMLGWPQGTNLRTRVAGASDQEYGYLERSLQQIDEATLGSVRGNIVERLGDAAALNPTILVGELRVFLDTDMLRYCGNATVGGCGGASESNGVIVASRVVAKSPAASDYLIHELGRSAFYAAGLINNP